MKIAIVTDKTRITYLNGAEGEYEDAQKEKTVKILKEIISKKYNCIDLIFDENIIKNLKKEEVDLVFNNCNGVVGESRISQLPAILESIEMPYTGSKPLGHALAYDKVYTGKILKESGILTPDFKIINSLEEVEDIDMKFPLFIKPSDEGSSRGIYQDSIVKDKPSLYKVVKRSLERYNPPVMVMEYIEGREYTVGVIENGNRVLPIIEIDFSNLPKDLEGINSFEVKHDHVDDLIYHVPANIDEKLEIDMEDASKEAFKALDLKDYARVDLRVNNGKAYIIEINSLPGLQKGYSDLYWMTKEVLGFEELIFSIINSTKKRYNLKNN
ncbi:MAG: D-alanine--D-alanine ligase family protein [Tissierella sp.]|uniref:D-alanine--D-alanine ligase family protein n=1 Tax=Tissierella sp. TaxID=41274 RepID=UPI003F9D7BF5